MQRLYMTKYRLRLQNGRVVGPLELSQLAELYAKKRISGKEECQEYPTGDWLKIKDFPEIQDVLKSEFKEKTETEATFIKKLSDLNIK